MSIKRTLLALGVLAAIMLVGCKQPIGLPNNDVHAASTTIYCTVEDVETYSGHVDWYKGVQSIWDFYERYNPMITRAYDCYPGDQNRAYPRKNGFCIFSVPDFQTLGTPTCTLYYYQNAHSGTPGLAVTHMYQITTWPWSDNNTLFWAAWNSDTTIATDSTHASNGWYKVPLTSDGCLAVKGRANGSLIAGWICRDSVDGTYTEVCGATSDYPPYIKVVY